MQILFGLLFHSVELSYGELKEAYKKLGTALMWSLVFLFVMWLVNIYGGQVFNFFGFFASLIFILTKGLNPDMLGIAGGVGGGVNTLNDKDLSQGAVKGLEVMVRIVMGALLGVLLSSYLLCTIPFSDAPWLFWAITAGIVLVTVAGFVYSVKGKTPYYVVLSVVVGVIAFGTWQLVPAGTLGKPATIEMLAVEDYRKARALSDLEKKVAIRIAPGVNTWQVPNGRCANFPDKRVPRATSDYSNTPGHYTVQVKFNGNKAFDSIMATYPEKHPKCRGEDS